MSKLVPSLIVSSQLELTKNRNLPISGKSLVNIGDIVKSDTTIAEVELPGELYVLRLAEETDLDLEIIVKNFKLQVGEEVDRGQEVFVYQGFFGLIKANVSSPVKGKIEFFTEENCHLGIRAEPKLFQLSAYLAGEVIEASNQNFKIASKASLLQAVFGVGGEQRGELYALEVAPDEKLREKHLNSSSLEGKIIFGGTDPDIAALNFLKHSGINGLITGSISDKVLTEFLGYQLGLPITGEEDLPFTLIVVEGFGELAFGARHLELLQSLNGECAVINGATQIRAGAVRPEIIVANTPLKKDNYQLDASLEVGSLVKIIRHPYFGKIAKVHSLPEQPQLIETGGTARVAELLLEDQGIVTVPRVNLELI